MSLVDPLRGWEQAHIGNIIDQALVCVEENPCLKLELK